MKMLSRLCWAASLVAVGSVVLALAPAPPVVAYLADSSASEPQPEATEVAGLLPTPPRDEAPALCVPESPADDRILLAEGECPKTCSAPYGPSCNDRWDCEEYCSDPGPQGGIPFCSTCGCCICA